MIHDPGSALLWAIMMAAGEVIKEVVIGRNAVIGGALFRGNSGGLLRLWCSEAYFGGVE